MFNDHGFYPYSILYQVSSCRDSYVVELFSTLAPYGIVT